MYYNNREHFEWSEEKRQANIAKHGIDFAMAIKIFEGPVLTNRDKRKEYGEDRYINIGLVEETAIIVVVHTNRKKNKRIISARPASRKERQIYHDKIQKTVNH